MTPARALSTGRAHGTALVLEEPLSLWGGLDPADGRIIDAHHPQHGASVGGRVLVMPGGRGSSSSASILAEAVRQGTAPAGIVLSESDLILAIGAAVAEELYERQLPIVVIDPAARAAIADGAVVDIGLDAAVTVGEAG